MERIIIQIYEIQTPSEAESMLELGVNGHLEDLIRLQEDVKKRFPVVEAVRDAERMILD